MSGFDYVDNDDADGENWDAPLTGRNCFVLMIDAGEEMFIKNENGTTHFEQCVACCKEIFLSIARKQKLELVSIVLYRTQKTDGKHAPENVVLLQPLATVTVTRIKRIIQLLDEKCESVKTNYGHSDKFVLAHALHYCQTVILESRTKVYVKNIILFTCNDDPYPDDHKLQHQTRKQAEEFLEHHIDFDVVGLGDFNSSKFYKELVLTSRGELLKDWVNHDPILSVTKLMEQIDKVTEKYSQRRCHLWLGSECALQVSLYKLYNEPKKFRTERMTGYEMQKMDGTTKVVAEVEEDEDDVIFGEEGIHVPAVGEDDIKPSAVDEEPNPVDFNLEEPTGAQVFVGEEIVPLKKSDLKLENPKIRVGFNLIGFVNTSDVPMYFSRGEPYLMIPGSNAPNVRLIFAHLLNACLDKGKSMSGWLKLTKSSFPCHVILSPTPGGEYARGREHSGGFIMSKMSFSDDHYELEEVDGEEAEASCSQQQAADVIVKRLTIPLTVDTFTDAEVRFRTNMIEALALDYDDAQSVDDDTDVDLNDISERLDTLSADFNDCEHLGPETSGKKGTTGNRTAKTAMMGANVVEMIQNGYADKLNVAQLKELLKNEGVKNLSAMNKSMLVSVANKRFGGPQQ